MWKITTIKITGRRKIKSAARISPEIMQKISSRDEGKGCWS
jgi:hypothetical protein